MKNLNALVLNDNNIVKMEGLATLTELNTLGRFVTLVVGVWSVCVF